MAEISSDPKAAAQLLRRIQQGARNCSDKDAPALKAIANDPQAVKREYQTGSGQPASALATEELRDKFNEFARTCSGETRMLTTTASMRLSALQHETSLDPDRVIQEAERKMTAGLLLNLREQLSHISDMPSADEERKNSMRSSVNKRIVSLFIETSMGRSKTITMDGLRQAYKQASGRELNDDFSDQLKEAQQELERRTKQ